MPGQVLHVRKRNALRQQISNRGHPERAAARCWLRLAGNSPSSTRYWPAMPGVIRRQVDPLPLSQSLNFHLEK